MEDEAPAEPGFWSRLIPACGILCEPFGLFDCLTLQMAALGGAEKSMNERDKDEPTAVSLTEESALRRALHGASAPSDPRILGTTHRAVLAMIDAKVAQIRARRRARTLWWTACSGAAAAVLLVAVGTVRLRRGGAQDRVAVQITGAPRGPAEQVDILAAYRLACRLRDAARVTGADDHNGDGRVDRADVDALARQAVSLAAVHAGRGS